MKNGFAYKNNYLRNGKDYGERVIIVSFASFAREQSQMTVVRWGVKAFIVLAIVFVILGIFFYFHGRKQDKALGERKP